MSKFKVGDVVVVDLYEGTFEGKILKVHSLSEYSDGYSNNPMYTVDLFKPPNDLFGAGSDYYGTSQILSAEDALSKTEEKT